MSNIEMFLKKAKKLLGLEGHTQHGISKKKKESMRSTNALDHPLPPIPYNVYLTFEAIPKRTEQIEEVFRRDDSHVYRIPFFHENLNNHDEVKAVITKYRNANGYFLLRNNFTRSGTFFLTITHNQSFVEYEIGSNEYAYFVSREKDFRTIEELARFYSTHDLPEDQSGIRLLFPIRYHAKSLPENIMRLSNDVGIYLDVGAIRNEIRNRQSIGGANGELRPTADLDKNFNIESDEKKMFARITIEHDSVVGADVDERSQLCEVAPTYCRLITSDVNQIKNDEVFTRRDRQSVPPKQLAQPTENRFFDVVTSAQMYGANKAVEEVNYTGFGKTGETEMTVGRFVTERNDIVSEMREDLVNISEKTSYEMMQNCCHLSKDNEKETHNHLVGSRENVVVSIENVTGSGEVNVDGSRTKIKGKTKTITENTSDVTVSIVNRNRLMGVVEMELPQGWKLKTDNGKLNFLSPNGTFHSELPMEITLFLDPEQQGLIQELYMRQKSHTNKANVRTLTDHL